MIRRNSTKDSDQNKRAHIEDGYTSDSSEIFETIDRSDKWQKTITKVVKAVVSIQFSQISNFDTETSLVSEATGFVVDRDRGIILTNRHVVGPGPFCGYAVFDNHEEAVVKPVYRDPIHDFGFLQFNPRDIKHMELSQLELYPDLAQVGTEIRVVGNDAGEKLSILAGFISRLDRNAPDYGSMNYNDFNTEYIQAAASASGGSSGSPVINEDGYAIALQAGGSSEASTDFFLPVFRPLRALECIRKSLPITRGDIQVEWKLRPFDECRRLGLSEAAEAEARKHFPSKIGLLVVELVLPEGPSDGLLQEGDTLISIEDEPVSTFVRMDEILDERVGQTLKFVIQRGGEYLTQQIDIEDIHAITPNQYVELAGATFNDLSYQLARTFCVPVGGVYINDASGSFRVSAYEDSGWLLESVQNQLVENLEEFVEVMKTIPDMTRVNITYRHISDLHIEHYHSFYLDRHWCSSFRIATRNDDTGLWDFKTLQDKPLPAVEIKEPKFAKFFDIPIEDPTRQACRALSNSFVLVRCITPIILDSYPFRNQICHGVVVDAVNGYILISRKTVAHDLCDIIVIIADSIDVPGKVVFLHPHLNYAIVKYDPSKVTADVKAPKFSDKPLKRGETTLFIGSNSSYRLVTEEVQVSAVETAVVPPTYLAPRYRGCNLQCVMLDSQLPQECSSGMLVDDDGTLRAFWLSYLGDDPKHGGLRMGLDVTDVKDVIESLKINQVPEDLKVLDATFYTLPVLQARYRGVNQDWITRYETESEDQVSFIAVEKVSAPLLNSTHTPLKTGDIILSLNNKLVHSMRDLGIMYKSDRLNFKVVRQMKEMDIEVSTLSTQSLNTSHVVIWCGAIIQRPHLGVLQQMEKIPSEVYVTHRSSGGPALQYGLASVSFITHINDIETPDLETFINVVKDIPDNTYTKIRVVSFDMVPVAISIKTNYHYFPTSEFKKEEGVWKSIDHGKEN
ncbi:pro-apoptotic serine protease Nma111p [[Candida] jaroonii]|uniref:Pro-apoptotic serine protease Nma111p n=1 Tax=[Candida] jaroonii TaxID=467808 RepID=A0ACA9Y4N1_9ASCO|nr:pro-apoptotic serine protease Nma111p [[Candida] jaroonii]